MSCRPSRAIVIGIDGLMPEMVEKFTAEGQMPHVASLIERGVYSPMLSSPPVDTPTNWTSLATGAWTGTHGINTFGVHFDGERFEEMHRVNPSIFPPFVDQAPWYLNQLCRAEYVWQAAERAGKRTITVNWPGCWPANAESLVTIDGSGPYSSVLARISNPHTYATGGRAGTVPLVLRAAAAGLESALVISGEGALDPAGEGWEVADGEAVDPGLCYRLAIDRSSGDRYDRVTVYSGLAGDKVVTVLNEGAWSPWLWDEFPTPYGRVRAKFRLRVASLSADGQTLVIYRTAIFNTRGWAYPEGTADALIFTPSCLSVRSTNQFPTRPVASRWRRTIWPQTTRGTC